ncbi:MAG: glycine/sarcosine/betaine reductase selenoprotein B family protein [Alphaproteobacteria bacterium]
MARLEDMDESLRGHLEHLDCPDFGETPALAGPPLSERRVAIITTAGLQRPGDRPFGFGAADYRVIPREAASAVQIGHLSTNFDRSGFQQDMNVVFPLDRLNELAADGVIGSVADYHYSFMGASDPVTMKDAADQIAGLLKQDLVDAVLLTPV